MSGFALTVNLELSDDQLDRLVKVHGLEDRDMLIEALQDLQLDLSDVESVSSILENLDYFNY